MHQFSDIRITFVGSIHIDNMSAIRKRLARCDIHTLDNIVWLALFKIN